MITSLQSEEILPDLSVPCSLIDKEQEPGKQLFQDLNKHVASASCAQPVAVGQRTDGWRLHFSLCSITSLYITVVCLFGGLFIYFFSFFIHRAYFNLRRSFVLRSVHEPLSSYLWGIVNFLRALSLLVTQILLASLPSYLVGPSNLIQSHRCDDALSDSGYLE